MRYIQDLIRGFKHIAYVCVSAFRLDGGIQIVILGWAVKEGVITQERHPNWLPHG